MEQSLGNVGVVVLAAGKGKRMHSTTLQPKVLTPLLGKPLVTYLLKSIEESILGTRPVLVVAPDLKVIEECLGSQCDYAVQARQLGTGHAVLSAKQNLLGYGHVVVLYGDHPLVTTQTINTLIRAHLENGVDLTLATLILPHFGEWFSLFACYGRIIRDAYGKIIGIVEQRDAKEEQARITEVNPGYYVLNTRWMWSVLPQLSTSNAQGEYYLTDLVGLALKEEKRVITVPLQDPQEALGINTPEQLAIVEHIMRQRSSRFVHPTLW